MSRRSHLPPGAVAGLAWALTLLAVPAAAQRAGDPAPPEQVFELRARDPQRPVTDPWRLLWPRWQETRRVSVYGWLDCGIGGNTNGSNSNGIVGLQDRNLEAMMDQLYLVAERRIDVDSDEWSWGARVDLLYGSDAWQTDARGLDAFPFERFDSFGEPRWASGPTYGLAMPQLLAEVGRGDLSVQIGHFYSPLGYESVPAVGNFFSSHSAVFMFGTPNTQTGVLGTWQPEEGIRFSSGVTNGWDNFSDGMPMVANPGYPGAASNLAYLGDCVVTSADGRQLVAVAATTGNEYTPLGAPAGSANEILVGNRSMVTAYWQSEMENRLTTVTEVWSAWQFHADTGFENVGQQAGLAQWYGICQYLYRSVTDRLSVGTRLEWFRDNNGYRVATPARYAVTNTLPVASGFVGNFWEITLGLNWMPTANWVVRPEIRYDWFTPDAYGSGALPFGAITTTPGGLVTGDDVDQWYLGCDAILQF